MYADIMYCFLCSQQQEGNIYENFTHALQKMKQSSENQGVCSSIPTPSIYLDSNVSLLLPGSTTVTLIPPFPFFPSTCF